MVEVLRGVSFAERWRIDVQEQIKSACIHQFRVLRIKNKWNCPLPPKEALLLSATNGIVLNTVWLLTLILLTEFLFLITSISFDKEIEPFCFPGAWILFFSACAVTMAHGLFPGVSLFGEHMLVMGAKIRACAYIWSRQENHHPLNITKLALHWLEITKCHAGDEAAALPAALLWGFSHSILPPADLCGSASGLIQPRGSTPTNFSGANTRFCEVSRVHSYCTTKQQDARWQIFPRCPEACF